MSKTPRGSSLFVAIGGLAASILMVPGAAGAAPAAPAAKPVRAAASADGVDIRPVQHPAMAAERYWTPERMKAAIPLVLDQNGNVIEASELNDLAVPGPRAKRIKKAPLSTGKMFFERGGGSYVCSASVIKDRRMTKKKNLIATAGHCVHGDGMWNSSIAYVPRYKKGRAPKGVWWANLQGSFKAWTKWEDYSRDHAVVRLKKRKGKTIVAATAGNRIRLSAPRRQRGVTIVGWPAQKPFNGELAFACRGRTKPDPFAKRSSDSSMRCNLTGGASGGPWFSKLRKNKGVVYTVSSRRYLQHPILLATPFPKGYRKVIRAVANH